MLQKGTIGEYKITDLSFKELIDFVLQSIPDKFEKEFPNFSIYEGRVRWGALVTEDSVTFDTYRLVEECQNDKDVLIGVIAHEFSHVFCEHGIFVNEDFSLKVEDEADKMAIKWGFKKEIKAFRKKIPATIDKTIYPDSSG